MFCAHIRKKTYLQFDDLVGPLIINLFLSIEDDLIQIVLFKAVMEEARQQQAATMTEFNWLGRRFPISNAKTRVSILKGACFI